MSRRALAWLPALLWAGAIFYASSQPRLPAPNLPGSDKVFHFTVYAVLGALLAFAAARTPLSARAAVALGLLYGVSDEMHQAYVPGRAPDALDWVADAAGVIAAVFLYTRWRARRGAPSPGRPGAPHSLRA